MRQTDLSRPAKIEWKGGVMQLDRQPYPIKGGVLEALKILVGLVRVPPDRWVLRDETGRLLAVQEPLGTHDRITTHCGMYTMSSGWVIVPGRQAPVGLLRAVMKYGLFPKPIELDKVIAGKWSDGELIINRFTEDMAPLLAFAWREAASTSHLAD